MKIVNIGTSYVGLSNTDVDHDLQQLHAQTHDIVGSRVTHSPTNVADTVYRCDLLVRG